MVFRNKHLMYIVFNKAKYKTPSRIIYLHNVFQYFSLSANKFNNTVNEINYESFVSFYSTKNKHNLISLMDFILSFMFFKIN